MTATVPTTHRASAGDPGPTAGRLLSTTEVATFVSRGLLLFEGVVPDDINAAATEELAEDANGLARRHPPGTRLEDCFGGFPAIRRLLGLPLVRGIVQSLVGPDPIYDHHAVHRRIPGAPSQTLHADAVIDLRAAFDIQLMYYPDEVGARSGGTLLLPGSHLRRINEHDVSRYQNVAGQIALRCPAGTVAVLHHGLWHCGRRNRSDKVRYMFKLRLGPRVPQVRLWDTSDLADPAVQARVSEILAERQPWYEDATGRLEQLQRAALWRRLAADPSFQVEYWLGRLENQADPSLAGLLPS